MKITLISPADNSQVSLMTELQREYLANVCRDKSEQCDELDYLNLKRRGRDNTFPEPVTFCWEVECDESDSFTLVLSTERDFSGVSCFGCTGCELSVKNLLIGQRYYWKVMASSGIESEAFSFTTDPTAPRWIEAGGLSNIRDIGGRMTKYGRKIRQGRVFRGCELEFHHTVTPEGIEVLRDELGINTDLDLRGEAVGKITRSALGFGVYHKLIPCRAYADFLEDKDVARQLFTLFTEPKYYPFYIHCWGGADRTGTLILILCAALGVCERELFADYELTSLSVWGDRSIYSQLFVSLTDGLSEYPGADIGESCVSFLKACGITDDQLERIRELLLE